MTARLPAEGSSTAHRQTESVLRYTDSRGKRKSAGTYVLKKEAQDAIDEAYGRVATPDASLETWTSTENGETGSAP